MKILVLTSRFPFPLEKGDKLRIFHQIRELSRRHDIVLCAMSEQPISAEDYAEVAAFCQKIVVFPLSKIQIAGNIVRGLLRGWPLQVAYFYHPKWAKAIDALIDTEQPSHIYCQLIRMSAYVKHQPLPKVLDFMDAFSEGLKRRAAESPLFLRPFLWLEHRLTKRYEQETGPYFDHTTIISAQDQAAFALDKPPHIVANGVDTDYFKSKKANKYLYELVFVGNMGYYPNRQAAKFLVQKILPLVHKHRPEVRVLIAGARPAADIKALVGPSVVVSGWLSDIRTAYEESAIFVAPLFLGSGQQNKILEAMALQRPCVTTPLVNNAIKATPDRDIRLADSAETFAEHILYLLDHPYERHKMAENGHKFIKNTYSWAKTAQILEQIIAQKQS